MRRARGALALLIIVLLTALIAGPAAAGGPTSVLLVADTGRTASLHVSDSDYGTLAHLLGVDEAVAAPAKAEDLADDAIGQMITVTWLIHDVQPWRVDHVYPQASGGPLIATYVTSESGDALDGTPAWHRAGEGKWLVSLLEELGVGTRLAGGDGADTATADAGRGAGTGTAASPPPASGDADRDTSGELAALLPGTGEVAWGLIGVVLGAALTVTATRRRSARVPSRDGADGADGGTEPPGTEEAPPAVELDLTPSEERLTPWQKDRQKDRQEELSSPSRAGR